MKITLEIKTDNAAFEECAGNEVARILRVLADKVERWPGINEFKLSVMDINGNKVGFLQAEE